MREYRMFAEKHVVSRALHHLEGLVRGISADESINDKEVLELSQWLKQYADLKFKVPFNELFIVVEKSIADGVISKEEADDILWLCGKIKTVLIPASGADIQQLHGLMQGIVADSSISSVELSKLKLWLDAHDGLKGCWPYDEIYSLLIAIPQNGTIDAQNHAKLMQYFAQFSGGEKRNADIKPISGICACDPDIKISNAEFCFTGNSHKGISKDEIATLICRAGGRYHDTLRKTTDYLVVGGEINHDWLYSCYGRKIEKAQNWRMAGHKICIIHENDLWDALADMGIEG